MDDGTSSRLGTSLPIRKMPTLQSPPDLSFFVTDILCMDALPDSVQATQSSLLASEEFEDAFLDRTISTQKNPTVIVFGRCASGSSICLQITNYRPWIRLKCIKEPNVNKLTQELMKLFRIDFQQISIKNETLPQFYGFVADQGKIKTWHCLKIYFPSFELVQKYEYYSKSNSYFRDFELTDSSTPHTVKCSNDLKIYPCEWISVKNPECNSYKISTCDLEYSTKKENIRALNNPTICPLKIMSFDAEMYSHDNGFPEVIHGDFVIAICATLKTYGSDILERYAFILHDTPNLKISNDIILTYCSTSHELLEKFRDLIVLKDPDILTGWNIYGFDMPFLWDQHKSAYIPKSKRGSEDFHSKLLLKKGRQGFLTTKELLLKNKKNDSELRAQIRSMELRWKLSLKNPMKLPEVIAEPIRNSLRNLCGLHTEQEEGLIIGGPNDFQLLQNEPRFQNIMNAPLIKDNFKKFEFLSKLCCERSVLLEKRMTSSAKGDNTYYFWSGRCSTDLMQIVKDDKKLEDNTLKYAAQTYLDPEFGKLDMTPAEIFESFRTKDPEKLSSMIEYCMRDSDIPILLIDKLNYLPLWVEMSRVSFTPISQVLNGGQQRKVYNLISHFVHDTYALNKADSGWPCGVEEDKESNLGDVEDSLLKRKPDYQGATVIEPIIGFYTEPISTCDFASLYPSVIIDSNLCPSTYIIGDIPRDEMFTKNIHTETHTIHHSILTNIQNDTYDEFQKQYTFVKNIEGVIPKLLQHLLKARKIAKKAMNSATNEFEKSIQNGRQLALKVSCNSVYGFFGVNPKKGMMSCKPIAAVTTLRGRAFIEASKNFVEQNYAGSKVIYGDTDSIMISWGHIDVAKAYNLAEDAAEKITQILRQGLAEGTSRPMLESAASAVTLANEKVYCPYLLIQKKTYAGFKYELKSGHKSETDADFSTCLDMKGVDAVRRDRSKLVRTLSESILNALLIKKDLSAAIQEIQSIVESVANQKAPLDWFILSKSLKSTYASENQPHVQAWRRMQLRGDSDIPEIGTRMPFVVVFKKGREGPLYERTEHPDYVKQKNIKYCAKYYLENAKDVALRLLGPTGKGPLISEIFTNAIRTAENVASGNMTLFTFFKKQKTH